MSLRLIKDLTDQGLHLKALEVAYSEVVKFPDDIQYWKIIGYNNFSLHRFYAAEIAYTQALMLDSNDIECQIRLIIVLKSSGQIEAALSRANILAETLPHDPYVQLQLGDIYRLNGHPTKTLDIVDAVSKTHLVSDSLLTIKAAALADLGEVENAITSYQDAITLNIKNLNAHFNLSRLFSSKDARGSLHLQKMQSLLHSDEQFSSSFEIHFAIAHLLDQRGEFKDSFRHLMKANMLKKKYIGFDISNEVSKLYRNVRAKIQPISDFDQQASVQPIFILGLPRSGSSLLEQILSQHPKIAAAGEVPDILNYYNKELRIPSPFSDVSLSNFRREYLLKLSKIDREAPYVIDKMPANFQCIRLINALFPNAKIFHTVRNPIANCLSLLQANFSSLGNAYCYDESDLKCYYDHYSQVMEVFHSEFSDTILVVRYEDVVNKNQETVHSILNHLGLDPDPRCFSHHESKRVTMTASRLAVSHKLYDSKVNHYKNFVEFMSSDLTNLKHII